MRYVVGLMIVVFFLGGAGLLATGVRNLIRRFAARRRLRPAEGKIVRIEKRQEVTDTESNRVREYDYPEIRFRAGPAGEITFMSELGAGASLARYTVGQQIGVLYDPDGAIPPMIDSWAGIWLTHLIHTIVGPLFILAAIFLYWAFGDQVLGR